MKNELARLNSADEFETIQRTGKMLAASGYFDASGNAQQAVAQMATKVLAGRELGFGPFASVNGIHIIKGRPAIGANLIASAVKGHPRYDYRVRKLDNEECVVEFFERTGDGKMESIGVSTFTKADAQAAGTQNMGKFPRNMLFARAMSNGVRWYCPDVFSGNAVYVPEELGASTDDGGNVVEGSWQVEQPQRQEPTSEQLKRAGDIAERELEEMVDRGGHPFDDDVDFGMSDEQASGPWYAAARAKLQNGVAAFADRALSYQQDGGPASEPQYKFLSGLLDTIVKQATGADDGHKRVLAVLCQSDISKDNPPSKTLASKLLDKLSTHKKVDGEKVENEAYDQTVVDACIAIYRAAESVATPSLFEAA